MIPAIWLLVPLLALTACAPHDGAQSALRADVAGMEASKIVLACPSGPRTVEVLGEGYHLRDRRTVFICTVPLAGGLACTAGARRHVLDFESRRAVPTDARGNSQTCRF